MAEPIPTTALLLIDESRQEEINVTHTPFTIGRLQDRDLVLARGAHAQLAHRRVADHPRVGGAAGRGQVSADVAEPRGRLGGPRRLTLLSVTWM